MHALDARQKVLLANEMEYDAELVQGMFLKVLETGFLDDNIASKMALILKRAGISDQEIMGELNEIVRGESKRQMKLKTNRSQALKSLQHLLVLKVTYEIRNRHHKNVLMCKRVWLVVKTRY